MNGVKSKGYENFVMQLMRNSYGLGSVPFVTTMNGRMEEYNKCIEKCIPVAI